MSTMYPSERDEHQWAIEDVVKQGMERVNELEAIISQQAETIRQLQEEISLLRRHLGERNGEVATLTAALARLYRAAVRRQETSVFSPEVQRLEVAGELMTAITDAGAALAAAPQGGTTK